MPLTTLSRYACYYGPDQLDALSAYDLAILQPDHHTRDSIDWLQAAGTRCVAYLSVGEIDLEHAAPGWCVVDPQSGQAAVNHRWHTAYIDCRSPAWQDQLILETIPQIMSKGFSGLFLDTLDAQEIYPATRPGVIQLVTRLRPALPNSLLIANRGFAVLDAIIPLIDAVVFEAFTSYFDDGRYATWEGADLLWTDNQAVYLQALCTNRPILALDYAAPEDDALQRLARQRAQHHGFHSFVGPFGLDWLPPGTATGS